MTRAATTNPPGVALLDDENATERASHGHDRADGEVDLGQDNDEEHADREDQDVGVLQDDVRQVARREEGVGVERPEEDDDGDERDEDAALTQVGLQRVNQADFGGHFWSSLAGSIVMSSMRFSWVASSALTSPVMRPYARV